MPRVLRAAATVAIAFALTACPDRRATVASAPEPSAGPRSTEPARDASAGDVGRAPSVAAAPADAAEPDAGPPPCPSTPWSSYGHDPARTSASDGCVTGPLTVAWRLTRRGPCGYRFRAGRILQAIADEHALFASVDCGGSPAVMRVSPSGEEGWTFSRGDFGRGTWPALAGDAILSTDDGVFLVDRETGKWHGRELDVWGEPLVTSDGFFVDNTFQLDGSGPFVGALDGSLKWKWRASVISSGKGKGVPRTGAIAFADGLVVHAAAMGARSVPSLAAHDAATGARKWIASGTWPESAPSIAEGRVFTLERWTRETGDRLVARALTDGAIAWSEPVPWARGPAPVIAGKLVLVHGAEGVRAHDRATGALVWSSAIPRRAAFLENATTMAAALSSRTLVVTSGPRVHVLALEDGREQWSGVVATNGGAVERPVIVGRTLYVTTDGALVRLDGR